jgi:hypothetical protein
VHDHRVHFARRLGNLGVGFRSRYGHLGVDLIQNWLDQIDGHLIAAAVNDTKFSHL